MLNVKTRMLPADAADYLMISIDKLYQMCRMKQIPHYKIGSRYFFTEEAISEWIREQERKSISNG
jgi:excisionase family DNA binding protein